MPRRGDKNQLSLPIKSFTSRKGTILKEPVHKDRVWKVPSSLELLNPDFSTRYQGLVLMATIDGWQEVKILRLARRPNLHLVVEFNGSPIEVTNRFSLRIEGMEMETIQQRQHGG